MPHVQTKTAATGIDQTEKPAGFRKENIQRENAGLLAGRGSLEAGTEPARPSRMKVSRGRLCRLQEWQQFDMREWFRLVQTRYRQRHCVRTRVDMEAFAFDRSHAAIIEMNLDRARRDESAAARHPIEPGRLETIEVDLDARPSATPLTCLRTRFMTQETATEVDQAFS